MCCVGEAALAAGHQSVPGHCEAFYIPYFSFLPQKMRINETKELRADIKVNRYVAVQRSSSVAMQRGCVMCGRISRSQPGKVRCRCAGLALVCNCNCSLRSVSRCPHCSQSSDQQQLNAKNIYLQMILRSKSKHYHRQGEGNKVSSKLDSQVSNLLWLWLRVAMACCRIVILKQIFSTVLSSEYKNCYKMNEQH